MRSTLDLATGFDSIQLRHEDVHQNEVNLGWWLLAVHVEQSEGRFCRIGAQEIRMAGLA